MTGSDIKKIESDEIAKSVAQYEVGLVAFLTSLGLPSKGVLVPTSERKTAIQNLPSVIDHLGDIPTDSSMYISKFVAAVGAGLFDAALNYLWDETISSLRNKVSQFDLDYFFSSVITDPDRRKKFSNVDDLVKLDDWELIKGCQSTGILTEIGYKHLDYIRNMRNWASAAHPNQNQLTGLQLVTWLQTCILEVIAKEPLAYAIEVKRLLHSIRNETLSTADIAPVQEHMQLMPTEIAISFLRTIFGMYTDVKIAATVKTNIKLVANQAWEVAPDEIKYELGIRHRTFAANAEIQRRDSAKEFLEQVNGLSYLPNETLQLEIGQAIQNLYNAHIGFNNFYNELPHARILRNYIPSTGIIPKELRSSYVKTVIMCAIGNGHGISNASQPYYSQMIDLFQDAEILKFCSLPRIPEFASRLQFTECQKGFVKYAKEFKGKTSNPKILTILDHFLTISSDQLPNVASTSKFKSIFPLKTL